MSVRTKLTETRPAGTFPAGTGFFVLDGELFLANAHTVLSCRSIVITANDGSQVLAGVVGIDARIDAAILRPDSNPGRGLTLAPGRNGDQVAVVGYPDIAATLGPAAVSTGEILNAGGGAPDELVMLTAELRPGGSGSAVIAGDGSVAGLIIGRRNSTTGVAASAAQLQDFLSRYGFGPSSSLAGRAGRLFSGRSAAPLNPASLDQLAQLVRPVQCAN